MCAAAEIVRIVKQAGDAADFPDKRKKFFRPDQFVELCIRRTNLGQLADNRFAANFASFVFRMYRIESRKFPAKRSTEIVSQEIIDNDVAERLGGLEFAPQFGNLMQD